MSNQDRPVALILRILMAWTFLYAAYHQAFSDFSVVGFLRGTKTFHDFFAPFATSAMAPITSFLVAYGHLLIGLSLCVGLMVRLSAAFGALLLIMYWMAHMDFPYIENPNNFLVDYHIVYVVVLAWLIGQRAGLICGLDAWAGGLPWIKSNAALRWVTSSD